MTLNSLFLSGMVFRIHPAASIVLKYANDPVMLFL